MKRLIINADDFGFTRDVNAGIVTAHREGVLTSTTLMANGDAFGDAVGLAQATPTLDVGCHLVLVQGRSLLTGLPYPDSIGALLLALARRKLDVYGEFKAQIERITAAGLRPTHLDSHKHTHVVPSVFRAVARLADEFRIRYVRLPLDRTIPFSSLPRSVARGFYGKIAARNNVRMTDHFIGFRLTGSLTEKTFAEALMRVPDGITEFMCHPGYLGEELQGAKTRLKDSRVRELEALTSPDIRKLIQDAGISLGGFDTINSYSRRKRR